MNNLPYGLVFNILDRLNPRDFISAIRSCKYWYELSLNGPIKKMLDQNKELCELKKMIKDKGKRSPEVIEELTEILCNNL